MDCYVVLWIPTIVYNDFSKPLENSLEKNISDIPGKELIVRLDLSEDGDFSVYTKNNEHFDLLVKLKREQISSNGLMLFSYNSTSNEENGFRFTSTEFPTAVYHMIKSFYHVHDFHDSDTDSSLPPFVSSETINIQSKDNKALLHYLNNYNNVISNTVRYIQLAIRSTRRNKDEIRPETRSGIQEVCLYARGYEVYMGVLYHSKYNTISKTESNDREWRHIACNIENGLRYIRTIEREYGEYTQQRFVDKVIKDAESSLISSNKSIKISKISNFVGIASLIIGIISFFAAFKIARQSTNELREVRDALKQEIETIPASLSETESKIQELKAEQDSLHIIDNNIQDQIQSVSKKVDNLLWMIQKKSE